MKYQAKISVVTPSFNEVDRIGKYFDAILNQTVLPYEIIVVDGGSKDGTIEIIRHFQKTTAFAEAILVKSGIITSPPAPIPKEATAR